MEKQKNYYQILGVDENATTEQIKKKYRSLARQFHPDHNPDRPDAEERFKAIQEAYDVLSDKEKRKEYDRYRKDPFAGFQASNGDRFYRSDDGTYVRYQSSNAGEDFFGDAENPGGFSSFFNQVFGVRPEQPGEKKGKTRRTSALDISTRLRLSFEQALHGGKTEITLPHGETIRINIPKGVHSGFKIRLKGRGEVGTTSTGDLYVTFEVEPHPYYKRRGNNLQITCTINPLEAILGVTRHVVNAYGNRVKVNIPPGTQHGTRLRLKGQGVQTEKDAGNLYVRVEIKVPESLSETQRSILEDAARKAKLI